MLRKIVALTMGLGFLVFSLTGCVSSFLANNTRGSGIYYLHARDGTYNRGVLTIYKPSPDAPTPICTLDVVMYDTEATYGSNLIWGLLNEYHTSGCLENNITERNLSYYLHILAPGVRIRYRKYYDPHDRNPQLIVLTYGTAHRAGGVIVWEVLFLPNGKVYNNASLERNDHRWFSHWSNTYAIYIGFLPVKAELLEWQHKPVSRKLREFLREAYHTLFVYDTLRESTMAIRIRENDPKLSCIWDKWFNRYYPSYSHSEYDAMLKYNRWGAPWWFVNLPARFKECGHGFRKIEQDQGTIAYKYYNDYIIYRWATDKLVKEQDEFDEQAYKAWKTKHIQLKKVVYAGGN